MMMRIRFLLVAALAVLMGAPAQGAEEQLAAWWQFDDAAENIAKDSVSGAEDTIAGQFTRVKGVAGSAVRLDGYSARLVRPAADAPKLEGAFSVEAWVAQAAYPWTWCPIVSQSVRGGNGYYFALGPRGEVALELAAGGEWRVCKSADWAIPMRKWMHVVGTFDPAKGLAVYVNGQPAGSVDVKGPATFAPGVELRLGMNREPLKPSNIHREHGTLASWFSLDGILDEVKIHRKALDATEVALVFKAHQPPAEPEIPPRVMPSGPEGPGRFGAYYTRLEYYPEWDALWRVDDDPDVLVRFDNTAARLVFWRGSRYSAAWVSEKGQWMADQSVEAWGSGENDKEGCFEHMQDRRCRYSHVRIIESHDARAVVHWRYAPVSSHDHLWREDEKTGRACWVDEYYYIYPDGTGIRKPTWKTGTLLHPRQFQESLPFTHSYQMIGDVIDKDFATVANLKGEIFTLKFVPEPDKSKKYPKDLTIQMYNFKARNRPFIIFEPGNRMNYVNDRKLGPRGLDVPGACNHWPVGQAACDGRTVQAADRPTHFLGFPISYPPVHDEDGRSWWSGLYGMTERPFEELVTVARSWAQAPELKVTGKNLSSQGYDRAERAYKLRREGMTVGGALRFELMASEESPIWNPAFVIANSQGADPTLEIDGKVVPRGKKYRVGRRHLIDGANLIIWLELQSTKPVKFELRP